MRIFYGTAQFRNVMTDIVKGVNAVKITERKEVTHTVTEEVIIGRKCDICEKPIEVSQDGLNYNYFIIHTYHYDWGNDSIESHEYMDACCPECVMKFTKKYIEDSFKRITNTRIVEIRHVRSLNEGAD